MPDITVYNCYGEPIKAHATMPRKAGQANGHSDEEDTHLISAPGYWPRKLRLSLTDKPQDPIVLMFDLAAVAGPGLGEACLANVQSAAKFAPVADLVPNLGMWLASPVLRHADRSYLKVVAGEGALLCDYLRGSRHWRDLVDGIHRPSSAGFRFVGSWRQAPNHKPALQVTLWYQPESRKAVKDDASDGTWVAEIDFDLRVSMLGHLADVINEHAPQLIHGKKRLNHPYLVHQALAMRDPKFAAFQLQVGT